MKQQYAQFYDRETLLNLGWDGTSGLNGFFSSRVNCRFPIKDGNLYEQIVNGKGIHRMGDVKSFLKVGYIVEEDDETTDYQI